jgi:hypothetical protein
MKSDRIKFIIAMGCGVLLATPIVWACQKQSNDETICDTAAKTCADTTPSAKEGGGLTCADAKLVEKIKKSCTDANDHESTCNDATEKVNCTRSTHCKVEDAASKTPKCVDDTAFGDWSKAYPKETGKGC